MSDEEHIEAGRQFAKHGVGERHDTGAFWDGYYIQKGAMERESALQRSLQSLSGAGSSSAGGGMETIWSVLVLVGLLTGVLGGAAANQYGHAHHWSASTIQWATGGGAIAGALAGATAAGLALFAACLAVGVILGGIVMALKYTALGIWWLVTKLFWPFVIMAGLTASAWGIMFGACRWMGWCSQYLQYFPSKFVL